MACPDPLGPSRRCPRAGRCQACGTVRQLEVATYQTPVGVFCATVCRACVAAGNPPPVRSWGQACERVGEHCQHLGIDLDQMGALLQADRLEESRSPWLVSWPQLASTDPAPVAGWWRRWPDANLGLATGRFDVLDLDGDQGVEALRATLSIAPWQHPGPVARSGSGGWHLLYAPSGLGNRVRLLAGWTGAATAGWSWRHLPRTPAAAGTLESAR